MRHIYILLIILGSVTTTLAQTSKPAPVISRYYHFTGSIFGQPVTVYLYRYNEKFTGHYYYHNWRIEAIDISGKLENQILKLKHKDKGFPYRTDVLYGKFNDSSFSGKFLPGGEYFPLHFTLKKDTSILAFDYINTNRQEKLPWEEFGSTRLPYEATAVWPVPASTHPATNLIKQLIAGELAEKNNSKEPGKVMSKQVQITYLGEKLLTLASHTYIDRGNADTVHFTNYICIDLVNSRRLTITDVIDTANYQTELHALLQKKYRAITFPISQNFTVTSQGIGFYYNPYEIDPHSINDLYLYVTFTEYSSYLTPEFMYFLGWGDRKVEF